MRFFDINMHSAKSLQIDKFLRRDSFKLVVLVELSENKAVPLKES